MQNPDFDIFIQEAIKEEHGIGVTDLDLEECKIMMTEFIQKNPSLWKEDIGKNN